MAGNIHRSNDSHLNHIFHLEWNLLGSSLLSLLFPEDGKSSYSPLIVCIAGWRRSSSTIRWRKVTPPREISQSCVSNWNTELCLLRTLLRHVQFIPEKPTIWNHHQSVTVVKWQLIYTVKSNTCYLQLQLPLKLYLIQKKKNKPQNSVSWNSCCCWSNRCNKIYFW